MTAAKKKPAPKVSEDLNKAPDIDEVLAEPEDDLAAEFDAQFEGKAPDPRDEEIAKLRSELAASKAIADTAPKPPSRRATLMYAPRGNSRFYLNGEVVASWDKTEPEAHIWRQIDVKCKETREDEVDVVHWPHRVLPDVLPPEEGLGVRATPKLEDQVKHEPSKQNWSGATTSYQTGNTPIESLG